MRRARHVPAVLVALAAACACAEPLELADWTIPVPEGARIIEYDDPPIEDRDGRIELVEDLLVGPRGEDPNYLFFSPQGIAVDSAGRMYVSDMGNVHVQVFDADGEHVRTMGREGEGPGELRMPFGITVSGGRVAVGDLRQGRLATWDLDGNHAGDVPMPARMVPDIFGTTAGSIVGGESRRLEGRSSVVNVALFATDGTRTLEYVSLPVPEAVLFMGTDGDTVMSLGIGGPSFAATPSGAVYATAGDEYQVLAFEPSGSPLWALRAARPRATFSEEHKKAALDPLRERFEGLDTMDVEWPEHLFTIAELAIDGHGHLYVFPYVFRDVGPAERPVEVYSPQGERLFAGTMSGDAWSAASGDFVYSLRRNEQTEEQELVRYRLVEPFD